MKIKIYFMTGLFLMSCGSENLRAIENNSKHLPVGQTVLNENDNLIDDTEPEEDIGLDELDDTQPPDNSDVCSPSSEPEEELEEELPEEELEEELPEEEPEEELPEEEPEEELPESDFDPTDYSCFSYLDCPNYEACDIMSSTCFYCTSGWQCNNQHDMQQTGPSFCCTAQNVADQVCAIIGTCQN